MCGCLQLLLIFSRILFSCKKSSSFREFSCFIATKHPSPYGLLVSKLAISYVSRFIPLDHFHSQ